MLPTLQIGPWQVATYWITMALAVTIGGTYAFHRLLRLDNPPRLIMQGMLLTVLSGFIGAFVITYLINTWLIARSGIFAHLEGLSIAWGIMVGALVAAVYCRWHRASLGRALDLGVVAIPLGQAIGRLGCIATGCCYGTATDSWLGMYLPDEDGVWLVRYPTQLMSLAANLVIFFILLGVDRYVTRRVGPHRSWPFNGFLALLYLLLFGTKRLAISFLRVAGTVTAIGPLSFMQLSALAGLLAAAALLLWNLYRLEREGKNATTRQAFGRPEHQPQAHAIGMWLQVIALLLLMTVVMVAILGAQCSSLCSSYPSGSGFTSNTVRHRAIVDEANPQVLNVWVDVAMSGTFSPALRSGLITSDLTATNGQVQGLPGYLDDLAQKGYVAIRVPHAPPAYAPSQLVPGFSGGSWHAIEFSYFLPPEAPARTTIPVTITRVAAYETIVNQRFPIGDGKSHWEVWWLDGNKFPIPDGTFRLTDGFPQAIEVVLGIDFGSGASALDCAGCPVEVLLYNGYTFIGPFSVPIILEGTITPPPGNPRVAFNMCPGQFGSRVQYITPAVRFTHTHWLGNFDTVTRTFTMNAGSSQGWGYTWYSGTEGDPATLVPGTPFTVEVGPSATGEYATCAQILAAYVPTIAVTSTLRETLVLTATSTVSPAVRAQTASMALAPGYQLNEGGGNSLYLPAVLRQ